MSSGKSEWENVMVADRTWKTKWETDQETSSLIYVKMKPSICVQQKLKRGENCKRNWICKFGKIWLQAKVCVKSNRRWCQEFYSELLEQTLFCSVLISFLRYLSHEPLNTRNSYRATWMNTWVSLCWVH